MADFSVNAIELSAPRGAGSAVIAPVQQQVTQDNTMSMLSGAAQVFGKELTAYNKREADQVKGNVVAAYAKELAAVNDALATGAKDPQWANIRTRAITNKYLGGYSQYTTELNEARKAFVGGTEIGEAEKQADNAMKLRQGEKQAAAAKGYTFYEGMSPEAEDAALEAFRTTARLDAQFQQTASRNAEARAQAGESRSAQTHTNQINDYYDKQTAQRGLVEVADKNFTSIGALGTDLRSQVGSGKLKYEDAQVLMQTSLQRVRAGLLAASSTNPELAAPWQRLFDDMETNLLKQLDPTTKSESELKLLKNQYDSLIMRGKLFTVSDPEMLKYAVGVEMFKDPELLKLSGSAKISKWLSQASMGPADGVVPETIVGTPDEKQALRALKESIRTMDTNPNVDKAVAAGQAVNMVNTLLNDVASKGGSIPPNVLKESANFFSSSEFGKMVREGKVDAQTMNNAKEVFQVSYGPAVADAILQRLDQPVMAQRRIGAPGVVGGTSEAPMRNFVNIRFSGNGVIIEGKQTSGDLQFTQSSERGRLNESAAGLNTLLKLSANLAGETNYAKYWEDNKHLLLPGYFMEGLKPGTVKNGYEFKGGDARDKNNYVKVDDGKSK